MSTRGTPVAQDHGTPTLECRELQLVRKLPDGQTRTILAGVDARFDGGTLSLITGTIGSGKSTLLHVLSLILRPTSGEVLAAGEAISRYSAAHRDRWRRQAGLAFQAPHFLDELSVLENVMVPLVPRARSLSAARASALLQLEALDIAHLATRRLAGLSGGERQRITLARALVDQPRYVFADEPTAHQDQEGVELVLQLLADLRQSGTTIIVVSHDQRLQRAGIADATWRLDEGMLIAQPAAVARSESETEASR